MTTTVNGDPVEFLAGPGVTADHQKEEQVRGDVHRAAERQGDGRSRPVGGHRGLPRRKDLGGRQLRRTGLGGRDG